MKRIFHTLVTAFIALAIWGNSLECRAQIDWSVHEQALFSLINKAREKPLETARSLGMDTEQLLTELSDLRDILLNGLPPLAYDSRIRAAASSHTSEMLSSGYYSHLSRDGSTWEQRMLEAGYVASLSGESLGMVGFSNFLQPAAAVEVLFNNMFRDELRADRIEKRNILSPEFEAVGVGMGFGVVTLGGSRVNAYVVTCNFGKSGLAVLAEQFIDLVNEARRDPLAMAEALGLDPDEVLASLPDMERVLKSGLPPLQHNELLHKTSSLWLADLLDKGFALSDAGDDPSPVVRVMSQGYLPLAAEGSVCIRPLAGDVLQEEAMQWLFEELFMAELDPGRTEGRFILEAGLKEASVAVGVGELALRQGGAATLSYAVVLVAGADAAPQVESRLIALMNRARANPAQAIQEAGFDLELARSNLPWLEDILNNGLPAIWNSERLHSAARGHTVDMAGRGYFSSVTPEGVEPGQRILSSGYQASSAGEVLGTVSYRMQSPEVLARELFRAILGEELYSLDDSARVLFNSNFTEVGIGVGGAAFSVDGLFGPLAIVTIDGASRMSGESPRDGAEMLFLELVNEARSDPIGMAAAIGMDPDLILAVVRGWGERSLFGIDAVYPNERLWSAARLHADDMVERSYYSHLTLPAGSTGTENDGLPPPGGPFRPGPAGKGVRQRIIDQGYTPMLCGEYLGAVDLLDFPYADGAVISLFVERFLQEMNPQWSGERLILDPSFQEIGIGLRSGTVPLNGEDIDAYIIVADFATSYEGIEGSIFEVAY